MSSTPDPRKTLTGSLPFQALVGVTDLAVERMRAVVADLEKSVGSLEPRDLPAAAQQLPALAVTTAARTAAAVADRAEATYTELAGRGKHLIDRVRTQQSTRDLAAQAGSTISLTRAAVTTARRAAAETASVALGVVGQARTEAGSVVEQTAGTATGSTRQAATRTRGAARKATGTARKDAASTRTRAKAASTSARKSAAAARKAAATAATKVGD